MKAENLVADRRYGRVLYETAKDENKIEEIHDELNTLREIFEDVPELGNILSDDRLEPFEKVDILHELEKDFSDTVSKFLRVIYEYGRMNELVEIINEYEYFYYKDKGILIADVTTAIDITPEQETALAEKIRVMTESEKVILRKKIDPSILGGMIVNANHRLIDNSVTSRLKEMHKELLS
ncbi:ATP synthase F1 subunit delta [Vagococcus xieshaowenii]|uniref:ATP synthase subunit delta n=1 Tax=Vagococcus xieshaowenii TaxID=2562451 RepID=A0AAJ5EGK2_9ENTE|nr:ATP synthase F1 subunit delta [Vagococcus xieshaowenii]QCA28508.1 F0F1 ATP synthase subunit delta [Vagococcus xieshaowenii]TFZ42738.1 F0F1 ATP synthase subunit delta [Vagococcus xieshaowenii]